ncbi:MotA/TolQ/ExbB proton channel family protein [Leptolyngbya sp. FACHB-36]|uniref:MotA/TolQ/ExbB proton channel family protein n=1 Tax=Leptolyngbya sp. FACHB-36 TaxID=2692808 RepID=UPI0016811DA7|nr:MotA/TolQ/ExbB proton channel family protein [Leptolyngbya sp. FACHB-36]MBD2020968.1 MotA/TolQ/ExbB proton channel family protein [Leptolyngbya sp. FACHB-36]
MAANVFQEFVAKGGPIMYPLVGLSIATLACAMERGVFWFKTLRSERKIVQDVMETARYSLTEAREIAAQAAVTPIGRFLLAPLKLNHPTPDTFRLALEAAGEKEFVQMRKGDKLLETVVGIAPLLGLLGTVTGLIRTFVNLRIGEAGGGEGTAEAAAGIGEALIATAAGMIVAILALAFFRVFVTLQAQQVDYFTEIGSELELIYREVWYEPFLSDRPRPPASEVSIHS